MKAAKSASDTQLRAKALSSVKSGGKGKGRKILSAVTVARVSRVLEGDKRQSKPKRDDSDVIDVEEVKPGSRKPAPSQNRQPAKKTSTAQPVRERKRTTPALPAPKPASKPAAKKSKGPKKETTPGYQRVYKATPAVDLNEGPNFGKTTSIIEPTFQPKTPKKKKNA